MSVLICLLRLSCILEEILRSILGCLHRVMAWLACLPTVTVHKRIAPLSSPQHSPRASYCRGEIEVAVGTLPSSGEIVPVPGICC